ncbi:fumarate reductase subunit FrdC [Haemophilus sputorum]|jgi:Fumarate reductase subunit C|uniref:fumarate reductase subunit FrdC n=1 Tax=Haemophilus sputorum TaxID=1078480 RepID=UPI0021074DBD|nr:fumarate reductase subunit FrdC [Haemophilus sputorum]MCQ1858094.1 fumarate reductase subunit FrdC [Haemophilus sputorum]
MTATTKRKAYVREMKANWWQKLPFYKMYMVREATSIPTVWFSLVLFYGVITLGRGTFATDFVSFVQNPIVIVFNLISLAAILYHAATLFEMTPQAMPIMVKGQFLPINFVKKVFWGITGVISLVVLVLAYI